MNKTLNHGRGLLRGLLLAALIASSLLQPLSVLHVKADTAAAPDARPEVVVLPGSGDHFYKLTVSNSGIQALTYAALAAAGLPVTALDPTTIQMYEQGTEIARRVVDADNSGTFNTGDYILFYGRAVKTYYTTANIYWLTYGGGAGLEMATRNVPPQTGLPTATDFLETVHLEQDLLYMRALPLTGVADRWYWYRYSTRCSSNLPAVFTTSIAALGVASGTYTATLTPRLRGFLSAQPPAPQLHLANFDLNDVFIGQASFMEKEEYLGTLAFDQGLLTEGSNTLKLTAPCSTSTTLDWGVINWYELRYQRNYVAPASGQFAFAVDTAQLSNVTITNVLSNTTTLYDITDPQQPQVLTGVQATASAAALGSPTAFSLAFAHTPNAPARYITAAPEQWLTPDAITLDAPSDLRHPSQGAEWIVITHPDFLSAAQRLALHRQTYQQYQTAVVDIQDVYDEFGGGLKDQEAIRAFVRYAYENWPDPAPRYVVLFGDGHYDPRDILGYHVPDFIPPYLAPVNPFDGVTAADNRYVAYDPTPPSENPTPFMSLGRLPARSLAEAQAIVDKIIAYETTPPHADWNRDVVFLTDNADAGGPFAEHSNTVADNTSLLPVAYNREKIYYGPEALDTYASATAANNALIAALNEGALFLNYNGHASVQNWASEPLFAMVDQKRLTNTGKYVISLPFTCLEGDFIDPSPTAQSFGESIVRLDGAGAVASWSPTGKGIAQGHTTLYTAFYDAIFQQGITEIGPATVYAKQALYDSSSYFKDLLDSYVLFGDPAMPIDLPGPDLQVQKRAEPASAWLAGQAVTYTLTYSNAGATLVTGVHLTDTLPAELTGAAWTASGQVVTQTLGTPLTWALPDLAPGSMGSITVTATVAAETPPGTPITNTATIAGNETERPVARSNNTSQALNATQPLLYALRGQAYADVDANGAFDPDSDTPLPGVTVKVDDSHGATIATLLTDAQGQWSIDLPAGTYTVTVPIARGPLALNATATISVTLTSEDSPVLNSPYVVPTGLDIEYARATWTADGALITWATRSESSVQAFNLYRSSDPFTYGAKIAAGLILPQAAPGEGATYTYRDTEAPRGVAVYYWIDVVIDPGNVWIGPLRLQWTSTVRLPLILAGTR